MHSNEDVIHRQYDALARGDLDALDEVFADDIVWHVPGRAKISRDYRGKEDVFGFLGATSSMTQGTFRTDLHDVLANDEHAVVLYGQTAQRDGRTYEDRGVAVFHVRDGKITEAWFHPGDLYAADEFWS